MKKLFLICFLIAPLSAFAQMPDGNSKQPVSIEASSQLEWLRAQNLYRATKDVVITQGDTIIKGDSAEAEYDPKIGQSAITLMTVIGNVSMTNQDKTITADKGVYDTRTKTLVMTGNIVTLTTPDAKVTSTDGMTYDSAQGIATATGNAILTEPDKQLKADKVVATLDPATNKLKHAVATGHVLIIHKTDKGTDISQSQRATYDLGTDLINLDGDVKLTSDTNHMQGDAATINLKTGVSNLKNNSTQGGRVRAIFSSGDKNSPMPQITGTMPMVKSKGEFEQPYAVDNKNKILPPTNQVLQGQPRMPGM
jgi:lipopolysaccharide export system protein LptA